MNKLSVLLLIFLSISSCTNKKKEDTTKSVQEKITYASGFTIEHTEHYTIVHVLNPWDTTRILHSYILIDRDKPQPESLPAGDIVRVPVNNIACLSSVDASIIEMLGDLDKIKAIAETRYVKMPVLRKGLEEGRITDIGEHASLNIERLLEVSPDIIIVSPYQNMGYGKLETTGISIVECASYMEDTPLGRAEWIRFIATFLKKEQEAAAIMDRIAQEYLSLKEKTAQVTSRPTIFSEKKYGQVWYVPGGKSYMAHFFEDAGADYIWKDDIHTGSLNLDFETVYDKAENADYWMIKADEDITYKQLESESSAYTWFKAWKERKIIFSNTARNNYYEEGVMSPDKILKDLIHIFHPEIISEEYAAQYYEWMKE